MRECCWSSVEADFDVGRVKTIWKEVGTVLETEAKVLDLEIELGIIPVEIPKRE